MYIPVYVRWRRRRPVCRNVQCFFPHLRLCVCRDVACMQRCCGYQVSRCQCLSANCAACGMSTYVHLCMHAARILSTAFHTSVSLCASCICISTDVSRLHVLMLMLMRMYEYMCPIRICRHTCIRTKRADEQTYA
jgi:hypothetical protein